MSKLKILNLSYMRKVDALYEKIRVQAFSLQSYECSNSLSSKQGTLKTKVTLKLPRYQLEIMLCTLCQTESNIF
jgi:hypothetical protein